MCGNTAAGKTGQSRARKHAEEGHLHPEVNDCVRVCVIHARRFSVRSRATAMRRSKNQVREAMRVGRGAVCTLVLHELKDQSSINSNSDSLTAGAG